MKRAERLNDETLAALSMLEGWQAGMWTAMPGILDSVDLVAMTASVQPAIQALFTVGKDQRWVTMPLLLDCPIVFPGGGGFTLTFPLKPGDECLIVIASRCIDAWWESGGVQPQIDLRMHDLSDGFVLPGVRSQPNVVPSISTSAVQLRNDAGTAFVEIAESGNINITTDGNVAVTASGNAEITAGGDVAVTASGALDLTSVDAMTITAPTLNILANVSSTGTFSNNGKAIDSTHYHTAQGATANTTTPKPP